MQSKAVRKEVFLHILRIIKHISAGFPVKAEFTVAVLL